jgi:hypothetical protein
MVCLYASVASDQLGLVKKKLTGYPSGTTSNNIWAMGSIMSYLPSSWRVTRHPGCGGRRGMSDVLAFMNRIGHASSLELFSSVFV